MAEASETHGMVPDDAEDMISALPDDVLCHVLSPLSSRQSVHTSLLARRWRDLWRSVPIINVSFEEFEDMPAKDNFEREAMFKRFVNRFLMLRNSVGVDEFWLQYCVACGTDDVGAASADANLWIFHVLQRNAWDVKVVNQETQLELVPAVFSSSFLNRLHLSSVSLVPGFINQLQIGCPALEYLLLCDCLVMDLEIVSNTLKVLILDEEVVFSLDNDDPVSISAASLISFSIGDALAGNRLPILKNMASLETASVLLSGQITDCDADGIRQLLGGLSHVTSLDFYCADRELTMEKNFRWCPRFSNLINLTLDSWCVHADFYALIVFLQNSPSLKKLTLKLDQGCASVITGELEDPSFTCEHLEIVKIICSDTSELLPRVTQFLRDSGPDQMRIIHRN